MILLLWGLQVEAVPLAGFSRAGPLVFAERVIGGARVEMRGANVLAFDEVGQGWGACVLASIRGNDTRFESEATMRGYAETLRVRFANQSALETGLTGDGLAAWRDKRVRSLRFHERRVMASASKPAPSPHRAAVVNGELGLIAAKLAALGAA